MEQNWDWARLGAALAAARNAMGLTQPQIAARTGVSLNTVKNIEAGTAYKKVTHSVRAYARAVSWTDDSAERVLVGGEPELVQPTGQEGGAGQPPRETVTPKPGLPLLISEELADGEIVDTEIEYSTEDGSVMTTITLRLIPSDATPEEKRASLDAYRRARSATKAAETQEPPAGEQA